jgi:hypothetical protein
MTRLRVLVHGEILIRQQLEGETSYGNDFAIGNTQGCPAGVLSCRLFRPGCGWRIQSHAAMGSSNSPLQ